MLYGHYVAIKDLPSLPNTLSFCLQRAWKISSTKETVKIIHHLPVPEPWKSQLWALKHPPTLIPKDWKSQQNRNQIMLSSWSPWLLGSWIILASVSLIFTMVPCDLHLQHKPVSHLRAFASTVSPVCLPLPPCLPFIIQVSAQMSYPQNWSPVTQTKHMPS